MRRVWALCIICAVTCDRSPNDDGRLKRLEQSVSAHSTAVDAVDRLAQRLGTEWDDVRKGYDTVAAQYAIASSAFKEAAASQRVAGDRQKQAARIAQRAHARWQLFRELVVAAALVDGANLDASRLAHARTPRADRSSSCNGGMSTAAYRAVLVAKGVALGGMDVDHIVPRSLGGADHPSNYQLLPSSVNRSIGNAWNEDKCLAVGEKECANAIAISRKCGSLHGLGF